MNRVSFEEALPERLNALADRAPTEPTRLLSPDQADVSSGRQRWLTIAAAAVLVTIAGMGIWGLADRNTTTEVVTGPSIEPAAATTEPTATPSSSGDSAQQRPEIGSEWAPLPEGPADGRSFAVSVWTGTELIIWGGETESETTWANDGAALNPESGQWRTLADSPLSPRSEHVAVWADDEMIICCGRDASGDGKAAAAYDPVADSWRELAAPPFEANFAAAAWTGSEMIVVGGSNFAGAAAYEPSSDTWSMLAEPPSTIERQADIAWTGEQLVVWARESTGAAGLIYDRAGNEWRQLPPLPAELAVSRGSMSWTGTDIVVWGATANNQGESVGARIRPGNDEWQAIAPDPLGPYDRWNGTDGSSSAVWTGTEILIWAGAVGTDIDTTATPTLAYNPATDSWRQFNDAAGTWHHPQMLWTGEVAVVLASPLLAIAPDDDLQSSTTDSQAGIAVEDLPDPIDLSVLSVRPNNLSLAVTDLRARATEIYPPGSTALSPDAASGAAITPRGDIAVWVGDTAYVFPDGDLALEPIELSPSRIEAVPGVAVELYVQPSADGEQVWIVQPAHCCGLSDTPTIIDRVDVDTGEILGTVEMSEQGFPIGETNDGLVVNLTGNYIDTGDGFVADTTAARIALVSSEGGSIALGPGWALATWQDYVVLRRPGSSELTILNLADDSEVLVTTDEPGSWSAVGGPSIPSTAQPLATVSSDGRLLIAKIVPDVDESRSPTSSTIYTVDLRTGETLVLKSFAAWPPLATWSTDGEWVLLLSGRDLELRNPASGETLVLPSVIPDEHFVLGAG